MNIFGLGIWELLLIFIVILLVIGPERLPTVAKQMGRYYRTFKRVTTNFTEEFKQAVDWDEDEELKNTTEGVKKEIQDLGKVLSSEVEEVKSAVKEATQDTVDSISGTVKKTGDALSAQGKAAKNASKAATEKPKETPDDKSGQLRGTPGQETPDRSSPPTAEPARDKSAAVDTTAEPPTS